MLKKDNRTIDAIYEEAPTEMREDCVFKAEYARALLSCGDYYSGIRLVKEYLDKGVLSNSVNNILLEGLSEGGYDEECFRFYRRLQDLAKEREFAKEPGQLFVHGYSALIRSMCHVKKKEGAEALYAEMVSKGMKPLPFVFFELCEVGAMRRSDT